MSSTLDNFDVAPPRADAMIESLRAFGYDLPTAIADLIDNSLSAGAKNIWIDFRWEGVSSAISIRDDGRGMSDGELMNAMRPGSRNPLEPRDSQDLGRFGLGMKTASFSQCRCLTVLSKRACEAVAARCWDLDYVAASNGEWRLLKGPDLGPAALRQELGKSKSGTVIIWQKLDRITGQASVDDDSAHRRFLDGIDDVKQHLSMVFHRYLEAVRPCKIWLNDRPIHPWNPFLTEEPATQVLGAERPPFLSSHISIQPYVLPHHSKIAPDKHKLAAGPRGWNAQQGFYIYRNRRLLVAGDWLGLGFQKEEHFKLARIQVDLPNTMDLEWEIDVKKSTARPPGVLRKDLKRIASATRGRACEIYRHRGKVIARQSADNAVFVWEKKVRRGKMFYEINRKHPLIAQLVKSAGETDSVRSVLRLIEETVPVTFIALNNAESPDGHALPFDSAPSKELAALLKEIIGALIKQGVPKQDVRHRVSVMEPFDRYPELVESEFEAESA